MITDLQSPAILHWALELCREPACGVDAEGRVEWCNAAWRRAHPIAGTMELSECIDPSAWRRFRQAVTNGTGRTSLQAYLGEERIAGTLDLWSMSHSPPHWIVSFSPSRSRMTDLEEVPAMVVTLDANKRIRAANSRWLESLGFRLDQVVGEAFSRFLTADSAADAERLYLAPSEAVRSYDDLEQRFVSRNGSTRDVILSANLDASGATHIVSTEVTTLRRAQEELREAEEEKRRLLSEVLETQKLESLGLLAGGIAHDFNNLLVAIMGHASLALSDLDQDSPFLQHLEAISEASERAADLCRQLLGYSGMGSFVVEQVDLHSLVRGMVQMLEVSIAKKAKLHFRAVPIPSLVEADATQIRQVVMNLVTNSADAVDGSDGRISIETGHFFARAELLRTTILGDEVEQGFYAYVEVADNGCGMPEDFEDKIFAPFFSTKGTGRGLGLAAVIGIVRGHKGTLAIESSPGRGTKIRVMFPALVVEDGDDPAPAQEAEKENPTVLVVDDEFSVVTMSTQMLARLGMRAVTASNGAEALDVLGDPASSIDLVLLDMLMPEMKGDEVLQQLETRGVDVPILLMSGFNDGNTDGPTSSPLVRGFLPKPFRFESFAELVGRALCRPAD